MHKKRDNSLQHGFMRFSPLDDCSVYYHGCHLNGKSTHYHCMQVPAASGTRDGTAPVVRGLIDQDPPFLPVQERGAWRVESQKLRYQPCLVARVGPSLLPYLVWGKFSELFIQTDIFWALTPRAALQMIPAEVFV